MYLEYVSLRKSLPRKQRVSFCFNCKPEVFLRESEVTVSSYLESNNLQYLINPVCSPHLENIPNTYNEQTFLYVYFYTFMGPKNSSNSRYRSGIGILVSGVGTMVEPWLPYPEICGSNPFYFSSYLSFCTTEQLKRRKKRLEMDHFATSWQDCAIQKAILKVLFRTVQLIFKF